MIPWLFTPFAMTFPVDARRGISTTWYLGGAVDVVGSDGADVVEAGDDAVEDAGLDEGGIAGAAGLGFDDGAGSAAGMVVADEVEALGAAAEPDELPEPLPHDAHSAAARMIAADRIAAPPSQVPTS